MSQVTQAIHDIPLAALIPVGLVVIVGVFLWFAGRRVLKASFAALGLILGAGLGWIIGLNIQIGIPPWVFAAVIGLLVACIAALGYRIAVAAALGVVLAVAAPLAVVTVAELQGSGTSPGGAAPPASSETESDQDDEYDVFFDGGTEELAVEHGLNIQLPEGAGERIEQARSYASRLSEALKAWWADTPENLRPAITASAIAGFLVGVLFGTLASSFAASVVTAFGGSLLWLNGLRIIVTSISAGLAQRLPTSAALLLVIWLIISLVGVLIQWMFRPKPADKSA